MKVSFNSIGKAFKKMFSTPKKQTISPQKSVVEKKKEVAPKEHFFQKQSTTAYGIKMRHIHYHKAARKANKIRRRRRLNKIAKKSRQVYYRIAA